MIIVIDGPAGSGKSSTAKAVAEKLGIQYLDSGALYRALTWIFTQSGRHKDVFFTMLNRISVTFTYANQTFRVWVEGDDITPHLRSKNISNLVSEVAAMPRVRTFVNALMNKAVRKGRYIAEGRDLGTAVFPHAEVKFFLTADVKERARRRYEELGEAQSDTTIEEVQRDIAERDRKDAQRSADPLKKASDAIEIDTTGLLFEEQVQQLCDIIIDKTALTYK